MTVAETVAQKLVQLPLEQQLEVLNFVESLKQANPSAALRRDPAGILKGGRVPTLADFDEARHDAWAGFPRELTNG